MVINYSLEFEKDRRIQNNLDEKTQQIVLEYSVLYNSYKSLSKFAFDTQINKKDVLELFKNRDRAGLLKYINDDYKKFENINIRQLHFHLPNNDSFLRMHRPSKHGDNLTKDRQTVAYVNSRKKAIDGFEEGKIYNGFRFVYPLEYKDEHIGSVELSFSALFFIKEIMKSYNVSANFLIKKDVVDAKVFKEERSNYIQSPLEEYYYEKEIIEQLDLKQYQRKLPKEFKNMILSNLNRSKPVSVYVDQFNEIVTFIPLFNPISKKCVAYLKISSGDKSINRINFTKNIVLVIFIILLLIILMYTYKHLKFEQNLEMEVESKTQELKEINGNLEDIIKKEVEKNKEKDQLMIAQSRHAAMGEMISMIAHQWRQPIAVISMGANNILVDIELDMVSNDELSDIAKDILGQTEYLTQTIDDFRDFFKPEKRKEDIYINDILDETFKIIGKSLENNNIKVTKDLKFDKILHTYSRELLQVTINLIKNAKEILEDTRTINREIELSTYEEEDMAIIEVYDNGGGVPEDIKSKIFEPYFSTKKAKTGTGLGLYMSKTIVEKHLHGILEFHNKNDGVSFYIKLPITGGEKWLIYKL